MIVTKKSNFNNEELLRYCRQAVDELLQQGQFDNGQTFRPTQREALEAYRTFLDRTDLKPEDLLAGFFEIPTGVGKTAVFTSLVERVHQVAEKNGRKFKTVIVVPTVQLLGQTKEDFENFSPGSERHVGLYGGKYKDLTKAITIMSYPAWTKLTESGRISSRNVQILISDEAHRGTSARKLKNIFRKFSGSTLRLAFTATAHFDKDKSVLHTHKNQIYYKKLADAIRAGELASYVQIRPHVIRVKPGSKDYVSVEVGDGKKKMLDVRWAAWNKRVVSILRSGKDRVTGDPLSDNMSGFFVRNTTQADALEHSLNNDPVLAAKAKAGGFKGVAVAIHSKLSDQEKNRRLKDLKAGRYMALVGDDMFKEGFDMKSMKNIFDLQHGSLVEKAQIIGRGARAWENEIKKRWEGLTIIDSIVYVGSDDADEDKALRKQALLKARTAIGILEDSYIVSPDFEEPGIKPDFEEEEPEEPKLIGVQPIIPPIEGKPEVYDGDEDIHINPIIPGDEEIIDGGEWLPEEPKKPEEKPTEKPKPTPEKIEGQDFEEYVTEEEARTFFADIERLRDEVNRKDYIEIDETIFSKMLSERKRTGIGPYTLLNELEDIPEGFNVAVLASWFKNSTGAKTAHQTYINYALQRWASFPSIKPKEYIKNTDEIWGRLANHKKRIGISVQTLFKGAKDIPEGLTEGIALHIFEGDQKSARQDHLAWLDMRCETFPDLKIEYAAVDAKTLKTIRAHNKRTGVGGTIIQKKGKNIPEGFHSTIVENLIQGRIKTIRKDYLEFILAGYEKMPNKSKFQHVEKVDFSQEKERTGLTACSLFKKAARKPSGMTLAIAKIIDGSRPRKVREDYQNWFAKEYQKQPDAKSVLYVEFDKTTRARLIKYKEKTGLAAIELLKNANDLPSGVTKSVVHNAFHNLKQKTIRADVLEWMERKYEALIRER